MSTPDRHRSRAWRTRLHVVTQFLPELNFITIHYAYFILTSLVTAVIFWGSSTPFRSIAFIDALFLTSSAMTEAGLNTINLSALNTWQQFMLFCLIMLGSAIWVSIFVVFVRARAFEKAFHKSIKARRHKKHTRSAEARSALGLTRTKSFFTRGSDDPGFARRMTEDERGGDATAGDSPVIPAGLLDDKDGVNTNEGTAESSGSDAQSRHQNESVVDLPQARNIRFESPNPHTAEPNMPSVTRVDTGKSYSSRHVNNEPERMRRPFWSFTGVGASASSSLRPRSVSAPRPRDFAHSPIRHDPLARPADEWFQSAAGYFTRNSQVYGLSLEDRQRLGGEEYSAILFLQFLVPFYFFIWQFLGCIACGAWIAHNRANTTLENGINPWWTGAFNAVSAFNNSGMSLLDANMTAFSDSVFMLISMGLFILAGNTAYPIFLRMAIWTLWKILPDNEFWRFDKQTLKFLLDHPRRCYTNMFPSQHTWWLGLTLFVLNGFDWAMFEILNIGNAQITSGYTGFEVIDGLFQALAVRSGGFYVVPIPATRISLQFLYVIMMYISAYPVAITMRNSNVYEERSLGISAEDRLEEEDKEEERLELLPGKTFSSEKGQDRMGGLKRTLTTAAHARHRHSRTAFVRHQMRAQLSHDAWWICMAVFLIMIVENPQFVTDPVDFSVFNVIFEVVSGYACVGISIGIPNQAYSFSGAFSTLSKLIMIAVMIRGRHRGLPVAIDHAIQLPSERLWEAQEEDNWLKSQRQATFGQPVQEPGPPPQEV